LISASPYFLALPHMHTLSNHRISLYLQSSTCFFHLA
jgi:hypothetical protein